MTSELGGGSLRMAAHVVESPATAEHHGHVELSWANKGGNLSVEKKTPAGWKSIASRASSPVLDSAAEVGEALYRVKNCAEIK